MRNIIAPHQGRLVTLMAEPQRAAELQRVALDLPSVDLNRRQLADLELLLSGALSPLTGFMGRADYLSVLERCRLADDSFWPIPVCLDVGEKVAVGLAPGTSAALRDPEGFMVAVLHVDEVWEADKAREIELLYGGEMPGGIGVVEGAGTHYVGGRVEGVAAMPHHDNLALRLGPEDMRRQFARLGWSRVLAFLAEAPLHCGDVESLSRVVRGEEVNLLLLGLAGNTEEPDHFCRVKSYQALMPRLPAASGTMSLLPLVPRRAGIRSVLWKAIIARNYGCSHLAVGEWQCDLADIPAEQREAVGVELVAFPRMAYVEERAEYLPRRDAPAGARVLDMSETEFYRRLNQGIDIPEWFSYPEVVQALRSCYPTRDRQGFTVFFTGLSGAGKSTLAKGLMARLLEIGTRQVTLLDGDLVRKHLSSELGFSKEHRDINIRRIGYVASEITKHRGIAICAPIAPYRATRRAVRAMIEKFGGFIEIHVATPIDECERRDRKGLYAKARAGIVKEFTGVSDPYEVPEQPELAIDTSQLSVDEAVQRILLKLEHEGYLR